MKEHCDCIKKEDVRAMFTMIGKKIISLCIFFFLFSITWPILLGIMKALLVLLLSMN